MELSPVEFVDAIDDENALGGIDKVRQAFDSIYDSMEQKYTADLAEEYGRIDSPYARQLVFAMSIPSGLIRADEPVAIKAIAKDSDNSFGRDEITIFAIADETYPEIAITRPETGFGPPEAPDFTLGFRTCDSPPQITWIRILDSRGFNLGDTLSEITEGRQIVVNIVASDPEVGVEAAGLYQSVGGTSYTASGRDETAPFQFHLTVPLGHGETLSFKADAEERTPTGILPRCPPREI